MIGANEQHELRARTRLGRYGNDNIIGTPLNFGLEIGVDPRRVRHGFEMMDAMREVIMSYLDNL